MAASLTARDLSSHLGPGEKILYDSNPNAAVSLRRVGKLILASLAVIPVLAFVWPESLVQYLTYAGPCLIAIYAQSHLAGRRVLVTGQRLCHQAHPAARWRSWVFADIERITGIGNSQARVFALIDRDRDRLWLRHLPNQAAFWQALPAGAKDSRGTSKEQQYHRNLQDAVVYAIMSLPLTLGLFVAYCIYLVAPVGNLVATSGAGLGAVRPFLITILLLVGLALTAAASVLLGLWTALHQHRTRTSRADAAEILDFAFDPDVGGKLAWLLRPVRPLYRMVLRWVY